MTTWRAALSDIGTGTLDRVALERLADALRGALDAGEELALASELERAPGEESLARWTSLAVALSAVELDDLDALERARRAALLLADRAATYAEGPAMVVRVARLREELAIDGADAAWAEAARREPLVAWAYPERTYDADAHLAAGLMRALADPSRRPQAMADLARVAAGDDAPDAALAALALELLADLSREAAPDLAPVRALAARVRAASLRAVLEAAAHVLAGDVAEAGEVLGALEDLSDLNVARSIADAMRAVLRGGAAPDVRALLREAWLEAMIDPVVALASPRSALAKLRSALVVLSITTAVGMAFTPAAQAQDPGPEQPRTEQTRTEQTQDHSARDDGGHHDAWSRDTPPSSAWARR